MSGESAPPVAVFFGPAVAVAVAVFGAVGDAPVLSWVAIVVVEPAFGLHPIQHKRSVLQPFCGKPSKCWTPRREEWDTFVINKAVSTCSIRTSASLISKMGGVEDDVVVLCLEVGDKRLIRSLKMRSDAGLLRG